MGRKRKHVYIDRTQKLATAGREGIRPGLSDNVFAAKVVTKTGSFEKRFTHKLCKADDEFLDAYVMINEIVVLVPGQSFDTTQIESVKWSEFDKSVGDMHGKRKKGAPKVKSDAPICEVHFKNGSICELKTPVGGQLIELNENLMNNHDLLASNDPYNGERYMAIIYPTTKLPGPQDTNVEVWKQKQHEASMVPKICYSYLEGTCTRGESCRFQHDDTSSVAQDNVDITL
mmetsp:Transcript_23761/g.44121  ORF Transcript_23761/g.44121 Transcript_23761/m.44121 type:complete len:230 (+) Transcript_23761:130-819(+)